MEGAAQDPVVELPEWNQYVIIDDNAQDYNMDT